MEKEKKEEMEQKEQKADKDADLQDYQGPERRKAQRRTKTDRRDLIRFELNKKNRRIAKDRRTVRNSWDQSHTLF